MEARLIDDRRQWNEFIASARTGHLCQTWEWADHSEEGAHAGALRVGALDNAGRLVAAVLLTRGMTSGLRAPFFYAPRGPVCDDPESPALPLLVRAAANEARKRGGVFIRIEPNVPESDTTWIGALHRLGFRDTDHVIYLRSAWVTDLSPSEETLLAGMMMTWRQNIRSGARKGVTVRLGAGEADLDAFYRLLKETGERDHFYVYPKDLYRDMLTHYSEEAARASATAHMALLIAESDGEAIAASTVAVLGDWSWNLHSGSSAQPAHRKLRPNYLLQWECMRWVKSQGARFYDWRTIPDILEPGQELYGVYEFKRGFGGAVRRVIPTMDLPLRGALYWPYVTAVTLRRNVRRWQRRRFERRRERERAASRQPAPAAAPGA
ncbi:MAG TPA: peptidoglycan bridge formation glycyltransferase FemA/FemB family protein [Ktedonobacterales bacterium]